MKTYLKVIIISLFLLIYINIPAAAIEEEGFSNAYFCDEVNCSNIYFTLINESKHVECAFYELEQPKIIDVLLTKNATVIIYDKNFEGFGTPVKSQGLMHHKFCVLNDEIVITGSYNLIQNQHLDNIIVKQSKTLAQNYKKEIQRLQGQNVKQTPKITHNSHELQNYFCKIHDCQQKIIDEINKAKKEIYFLTFTFTDKKIAREIIKKQDEGVHVLGVIENFQNKQYWVQPLFEQANTNLTIHNKQYFQHNKVIIIDNTTITGSYNPTKSANTINDENIVIINDPFITNKYKQKLLDIKNYK